MKNRKNQLNSDLIQFTLTNKKETGVQHTKIKNKCKYCKKIYE